MSGRCVPPCQPVNPLCRCPPGLIGGHSAAAAGSRR